MRRLTVTGPGGAVREVVLRSFVTPFFRRHAPGLLGREHRVLGQLAGTSVPAPRPLGVDPDGAHCAAPSLLMTLLPGGIRLADDDGLPGRVKALAELLVTVHQLPAEGPERPRPYQAWAGPERVRVPEDTARPALWRAAIAGIDRPPPPFEGRFLHRDFHPGNVLFDDAGRITGLVDWVETSLGPADLDVAHCATALALLHGPEVGLGLADHYRAAGGRLAPTPEARRYWRLLDALGFAPDAEKVATPWRTSGRPDLTPTLLTTRLETYLTAILDNATP